MRRPSPTTLALAFGAGDRPLAGDDIKRRPKEDRDTALRETGQPRRASAAAVLRFSYASI